MRFAIVTCTALALSAPAFAQESKLTAAPTVSTQASLLIGALGTTSGTASIASVVALATVSTVQSTGSTK